MRISDWSSDVCSSDLRVQTSIDAHRPRGRFWYLHYVGVRPDHQGQGHGGRIIRAQTATADAERLPCWLETATPANVPLYERLGFVIAQQWVVAGGGLPVWGMKRHAVGSEERRVGQELVSMGISRGCLNH